MKNRRRRLGRRAARAAFFAAVAFSVAGVSHHASAASDGDKTIVSQFKSQIDAAITTIRQSELAVMSRAAADIRHARAVPMDIGCTRTVAARCKALDATLTDLHRTDASDIRHLQTDLTDLRKDSASDAMTAKLQNDLATVQSSVVANDRIVNSDGSLLLSEQATPAGQITPAGGIGSNYCPLGTTYTWVGSTVGSFSTTRNWSPSGIPGSNDFMVVNQSKAATINMPASAVTICGAQIQSGTTFNLSGYNLSFSNAFSIVQATQVTVEGTGTFSANGSVINATNTTLEVTGSSSTIAQLYQDFGSAGYFPTTLLAAGGAFQFLNNQHLAALTLTNGGTATMENESAIDTMEVAGNVSTDSTSTLTMGSNNLLVDSPGTFSNAGIFTSSGTVTASISNSGSFGITGSMLESNSYINTAGTTTISSALVIYPGGSYTQTGGTTNANSVVINPAGSYNQTGGTVTVGSLTSTGNFNWTGGTIQITNGSLTLGANPSSAVTVGIGSSSATPISGLSSGMNLVSAGGTFNLAVQNGELYAWGQNNFGQLGNGTNNSSSTPVAVTGLSSGVTVISAGYWHALAVQNGAAYAWGYDFNGELGNGANNPSNTTPVAVTGMSSGVTAVAAGFGHSLGVQNGGAYAWGNNYYGQLGNGSTNNSNTPVQVSGLSSGVTAVAAGEDHSLALQNGGVYAWGWNYIGQLGNGTNTNSSTPVAVTGLSSGVTAIAAGWQHSMAVQNGNVFDWGDNSRGQLGNGTYNNSNTPVEAIGITSTIVSVAASQFGSYALAADGSIWDWGEYNTSYTETPQHLLPPTGYLFTGISASFAADNVIAILAPVNTVAANLTVTSSMSLQLTGAGQSLNLANTINLAGGSIIAPVMAVQSGGVFNASAGTMTIGGALTVNSGGSYSQTGGTVSATSANFSSASSFTFGGGTMTINGGALLPQSGSNFVIGGTNAALLNLQNGASLSLPSNALTIAGSGAVNITSTSQVSANVVDIGTSGAGGATVFCLSATIAAAQYLHVGTVSNGTLLVSNGGQVSTGNLYIAGNSYATSAITGTLTLGAAGSTDGGSAVTASTAIYVGDIGQGGAIQTGILNVYAGTTISTPGALSIQNNTSSMVNLAGGKIAVGSLNTEGNAAALNWTSGTLNITGVGASSIGSLTIPAGGILNLYANVGSGILVRNLGAITLSAESAQMNVLGTSNSHNRQLIVMSGLTFIGSTGAWQGMLDLIDNDMDVQGGSLSNITSQVKEAYNGGNWSGAAGIVSSYAAANTTHLTTLGVIQNNQSGSPLYTSFDSYTGVGASDILVKYTYYGDANLDGKVDGSDYTRIDNGYLNHLTGWFNGDFNYDGVINGSDYTLIDNAFNTQGAALSSEVASVTAQLVGLDGANSPVPEPAIFGLLGITLSAFLCRRRRSEGVARRLSPS